MYVCMYVCMYVGNACRVVREVRQLKTLGISVKSLKSSVSCSRARRDPMNAGSSARLSQNSL
jgi:hypothetical protein